VSTVERRETPRQELLEFVETGRLRQQVEGKLSIEAADLLVNVVIRYCEPRRPRRRYL
jgi:hypothetical protein